MYNKIKHNYGKAGATDTNYAMFFTMFILLIPFFVTFAGSYFIEDIEKTIDDYDGESWIITALITVATPSASFTLPIPFTDGVDISIFGILNFISFGLYGLLMTTIYVPFVASLVLLPPIVTTFIIGTQVIFLVMIIVKAFTLWSGGG